eukprot:gene3982-4531_t
MDKPDPLLSDICKKIDKRRLLENEHRAKRKAWAGKLAEASSSEEFNETSLKFVNDLRARSRQENRPSISSSSATKTNKNRLSLAYKPLDHADVVDVSMVGEGDLASGYGSPGESSPPSPLLADFDMDADDDNNFPLSISKNVKMNLENSDKGYFKLDPVINYVYELAQRGGISPVNQDYTCFCLLDFDEKQGSLKERSYVFVMRKSIKFEDQWNWLYACTCTRGDVKYLATLSQNIPLSRFDFGNGYRNDCFHIKLALQLMLKFDARNNIDPESHFKDKGGESPDCCPIFGLFGSDNVVAVFDQDRDEYGAVTVVKNRLSCLSCVNSTCCAHIVIMRSFEGSVRLPPTAVKMLKETGADAALNEEFDVDSSLDDINGCLSWRTIPFENTHLAEKELTIINLSRSGRVINLVPTIINDQQHCGLCSSLWSRENSVERGWVYCKDAKVFMDVGICFAQVYYIKCSNKECEYKYQYDGLEDGLLNMGQYLVSHKLLRRFMLSFLRGRMPIYIFHSIYVQEKRDDGLSELVGNFVYNKFKDSWYSYLRLTDIDVNKNFECSKCLNSPAILLMDATSLSFRRELTHWRSFLQTVEKDSPENIPRYSKFKERIVIKSKSCRTLLLRYCNSSRRKKNRLSRDEYDELLDLLQMESPDITTLVKEINDSSVMEDHQYTKPNKKTPTLSAAFTCPHVWVPFIEALGTSTPVCGVIHQDADLLHSLEELIASNSVTSAQLKTFKSSMPILHDVIVSHADFRFPKSLIPVLKLMIESCNKKSTGHPTLLPGIFTMFCEHEICYGFEIMLTEESPDVPFSFIFTRFEKG